MVRPQVLEIYSGFSGLSLGLEGAGAELVCAIDNNPVAAAVHEYNFPDCAQICKDIRDVTADDVYNAIASKGYQPNISILVGGSPCQDFSVNGKRNSSGTRGKLVFEFVRMLELFRPKYFIYENVREIMSGEMASKFFEPFLNQIEELGYVINKPHSVLNAIYFGSPQTRTRLYLIGRRSDCPDVQPPTFDHDMDGLTNFVYVGEAISDLARISVEGKSSKDFIDSDLLNYFGKRESFNLTPSGKFKFCHKRFHQNRVYDHVGTVHKPEVIARFSKLHPGQRDKISRFPKLDKDAFCPTLLAGTNSDRGSHTSQRPIHYDYPRVISPREYMRLQGFPDFYRGHATKWRTLHGIGNSVIPLVSVAIAKQIMKSLEVDLDKININNYPQQDEKLLSFNHTEASFYYGVKPDIIPARTKKKKKARASSS